PAAAPLADIEPPPSIRAMTPMFPMPTPFPSARAHAAPPPPAPTSMPEFAQAPAEVISFPSAAEFRNGESRSTAASSSSIELTDSIREAIQPEPDLAGPTVFNTATEATTASNATVAVPELAGQVKAAKKRGSGGTIATFVLFLAALSGAAAYLW